MHDGWLQRALLTGLVGGLLMTGGCRSAATGPTGVAEAEAKLRPPIAPTPVLESSPLKNHRQFAWQPAAPTSEPVPAEPVAVEPVVTPVAVAEPTPARSYEEYEVKKGDSLYKLSRRFYGNDHGWKKIYQANEEKINNPDRLLVGTLLRIPR